MTNPSELTFHSFKNIVKKSYKNFALCKKINKITYWQGIFSHIETDSGGIKSLVNFLGPSV